MQAMMYHFETQWNDVQVIIGQSLILSGVNLPQEVHLDQKLTFHENNKSQKVME